MSAVDERGALIATLRETVTNRQAALDAERADRAAVEAERDEARGYVEDWGRESVAMLKRAEAAEERSRLQAEALSYYAERRNHTTRNSDGSPMLWWNDSYDHEGPGARARAALAVSEARSDDLKSEPKISGEALVAWIETCRDLGRGALKADQQWPPSEPAPVVPLETALDHFDRQVDNILGRVVADARASETPSEQT